MTIDEAIRHAEEVAENYEFISKDKETTGITKKGCAECAEEHRQLANWLQELKEAKRLLKLAILDIYHKCGCENSDCDICANNECDYDDRFIWKYKDEAFKIIDKE